jgi:hypothetical protein
MSKVGKLGEKTLSAWCSEPHVEIIATSPDEDARGWDFLLEFPLDNEKLGFVKDFVSGLKSNRHAPFKLNRESV